MVLGPKPCIELWPELLLTIVTKFTVGMKSMMGHRKNREIVERSMIPTACVIGDPPRRGPPRSYEDLRVSINFSPETAIKGAPSIAPRQRNDPADACLLCSINRLGLSRIQ